MKFTLYCSCYKVNNKVYFGNDYIHLDNVLVPSDISLDGLISQGEREYSFVVVVNKKGQLTVLLNSKKGE